MNVLVDDSVKHVTGVVRTEQDTNSAEQNSMGRFKYCVHKHARTATVLLGSFIPVVDVCVTLFRAWI